MSFHDCLIVQRADEWFILVGSESESLRDDVTPEEIVTCAQVMLEMAGSNNARCVLAPASTSSFFATIPLGETLDLRDRAELTYELEGHVPIDAESMVADFVIIPNPPSEPDEPIKRLAAVAIEVDRWAEIADAFEAAGIVVRSIVPAAVLVARSISRQIGLTEVVEVLLADEDQCDLITIRSETIVAWKHVSLDPPTLRRHKRLDASADRVLVVGADEAQQGVIRDVYGPIDVAPETVQSHLVDGLQMVLTKESRRWFDLRRDHSALRTH